MTVGTTTVASHIGLSSHVNHPNGMTAPNIPPPFPVTGQRTSPIARLTNHPCNQLSLRARERCAASVEK
jgi:hypothetical protein